MNQKSRENRLRLLADQYDLHIVKSRTRTNFKPNDHGEFALFDNRTNFPVWGWDFDLDLDDIEAYLTG